MKMHLAFCISLTLLLGVSDVFGNPLERLLRDAPGRILNEINRHEQQRQRQPRQAPRVERQSQEPSMLLVYSRQQVLEIQAALNALDYNAGEVDGAPGQGTRNAVRRFQRDRGYRVDGFLKEPERQALITLANQERTKPRTAESGEQQSAPKNVIYSREEVRRIQSALNAIDIDVGAVDGVAGRATENGVRTFQRRNGFEITGVLLKNQRKRLFEMAFGEKEASNELAGNGSPVDVRSDQASPVLHRSFSVEGGLLDAAITNHPDCDEPAVAVTGPSVSFFANGQPLLRENVEKIGSFVSKVCPDFTWIDVVGLSGAEAVFEGTLKKAEDWELSVISAPLDKALDELGQMPVDSASLERVEGLLKRAEVTLGGDQTGDHQVFYERAALLVTRIAQGGLLDFDETLGELGNDVADIAKAEALFGEYERKYAIADQAIMRFYRLSLEEKLSAIRNAIVSEFDRNLGEVAGDWRSRAAKIVYASEEAEEKGDLIPEIKQQAIQFVAEQTDSLSNELISFKAELDARVQDWDSVRDLKEIAGDLQALEPQVAVLARYREAVAERADAILHALRAKALEEVATLGSTVADLEQALEAGGAISDVFVDEGYQDIADELQLALADRIDELIIDGFDNFVQELDQLEASSENLELLKEISREYEALAEHLLAFFDYADAVGERFIVAEGELCRNAQLPFAEYPTLAEMSVQAGAIRKRLSDFACDAAKRGNRIEKVEGIRGENAYRMRFVTEDETSLDAKLRPVSDQQPEVLIGIAFIDGDVEERIDSGEWNIFAGQFSREIPSAFPDAEGITACDRLAGDPHDPQRVAPGVPEEEVDAEAAIEACIAALEHDETNPRLQFQLGRALQAFGLQDDAESLIEAAAEARYLAAIGYWGGYLLLRDDGYEQAMHNLERAAAAGYGPSKNLLEVLNGGLENSSIINLDDGRAVLKCETGTTIDLTYEFLEDSFQLDVDLNRNKITVKFEEITAIYGDIFLSNGKEYDLNIRDGNINFAPNRFYRDFRARFTDISISMKDGSLSHSQNIRIRKENGGSVRGLFEMTGFCLPESRADK